MTKTATTNRDYNAVRDVIEGFHGKCEQLQDLIKTRYPIGVGQSIMEPLLADVSVGDGNYILNILLTKVQNAVNQALKEYAYARYLFDKTNN